MTTMKTNTYIELYKFLQKCPNIIAWLREVPGQESGYRLESSARLLAGFGFIDKIASFELCKGNYNEGTIEPIKTNKDIFYEGSKPINIRGNGGDSSDITMASRTDLRHLLPMSSKSKGKERSGGFDIADMVLYSQQYLDKDYKVSFGLVVKDKESTALKMSRAHNSSQELVDIYNKATVIDEEDLKQAHYQFKISYANKDIDSIIDSDKSPIIFKLHQLLGIMKTLRMKNCGKKKSLWGHIQRSGKSYIIAGCIFKDSMDADECNYLVITTTRTSTQEQQYELFNKCQQLQGFNIVILDGENKKPTLTKKNIILCSKQFLQTKIHEGSTDTVERTGPIGWLKAMKFNMRFLDESHNGGTTELAQKILDYYGKNTFTVQITATYSKPANDYNISRDSWILWDLEDIQLCKNIDRKGSIDRLVEKHGEEIRNMIDCYSLTNIVEEYSKYPELHMLTDNLSEHAAKKIRERNNIEGHENDGDSLEGRFLLTEQKFVIKNKKLKEKSSSFQSPCRVLDLFYRTFGKMIPDEFGDRYDPKYPRGTSFLERIEEICHNPETRSRFIGEGDFAHEPMIIMAFLPQNNIDKTSKALTKLLKKHNVIPDYEIVCINSKITNDPKQSIEDARIKAHNSGKKGVLVLSGRQCSLGVTIDNCDIVLLLNNSMKSDMIYQMMFRCMTQGKNKNCGFVVDLNIHRVVGTSVTNYASSIKPCSHPRDAVKYILQERLININCDHWMPSFNNIESKLTTLCGDIYDLYSSNTENAIGHFLNRLSFKEVSLTKEEREAFKSMFSNTPHAKQQNELIENLMEDDEEKIKKGIKKTKVESDEGNTHSEVDDKKEEEEQINYMDILRSMIVPICFYTYNYRCTELTDMYKSIVEVSELHELLLSFMRSSFGKHIDENMVKDIMGIYSKYMSSDKETSQIIRTVKELIMKNIHNPRELSNIIDNYLIPQELEKKMNAEVSTPFILRQEMLDMMPPVFWKSIKKVFEPCAGKGGFIVDIIDRFMIGLKDAIPDEKERYKTIVEECLYFGDINPTNIFICKLLIDPKNVYELNYYEGSTLELDIQEKWGIEGFDAVVINPPYNASGDTGTGNTIWQNFTKVSLDKWIKTNGYLLCVHPPGWRKPNTERGKFYGLYRLMTEVNQMVYLSIHGIKDGKKTFNCGTRYDWYLIQKTPKYTTTIVNDEKGSNVVINMNDFSWLPNYNIESIENLLAGDIDDKCQIIQSMSAYEPRKKWMSKEATDEYRYPCIHSTPKKGPVYKYSKTDKRGHFGVSKVIFGDSGINEPIVDIEGCYGMTQHAMAIRVENIDEANQLCKSLKSDKMACFVDSCSYSSYAIDWNIFKDMRRDFWEEFI